MKNGFWLVFLRTRIGRTWWLPVLFLLATAAAVKAGNFTYTINSDGTITIAKYTGSGGTVVIPSAIDGRAVSSIGALAFCSCTNLTAITVNAGNPVYSSVAGVLFNKSQTTLIQCPAGKAGDYTIPNRVTSIGDGAFYGCTSLTSLTIPNTVTSIGNYAFQYCIILGSLTIPNSVASIGNYAFSSCASLASVTIPASVTSIGNYAFDKCVSLTTIAVNTGNPVYSSVAGALFNKSQTTLVQCPAGKTGNYTIPNSVTSIGDAAFNSCAGLTSLTIPNNTTSIGNYAFYGCGGLTSLTIPSSVISIGNYAFYGCDSLATITMNVENSVYSSVAGVLFNKSQTTLIQCLADKAGSYTIPNSVTSIGDEAFFGCVNLTSLTIPNSVNSIGNYAFYGCDGLTGLTIPNSVASIGNAAFDYCAGLASLTIPSSVTSIGDYSFYGCDNLTTIAVDTGNSVYGSAAGVLFNKSQTTLIQCPAGKAGDYTIPNTVTNIGNNAFIGCTSLTSLAIPNSVTSIGDEAFMGCTSLASLAIPNSVTSIGDEAFVGCTSLTSLAIPNSVTSIGSSAFSSCTSLTGVTIPNSVTSIKSNAFDKCASLTTITVDTGNSVYSSVAGVLFNKSQTTLIQCPAGETGNYTIPNSVTSIGNSAFDYCAGLVGVTIPNSVVSIGNYAFFGCAGLAGVTIPNSVTSIGTMAFGSHTSLASVTIPDSVTSIGGAAFYDYTSLASVMSGNGVTDIGTWTIQHCYSLAGVYFEGNAPSLDLGVFAGDDNATVYYLAGTTGWGPTFGGRPTALWSEPIISPVIEANGLTNDITISRSDNLSITIQLDPGQYAGMPVDWWIVARSGSTWIYMDSAAEWQLEGAWRPMYQGGLFNLPATQVWSYNLPVGLYTFYFIIAYPMDGLLDGLFWSDSVNVTVQ